MTDIRVRSAGPEDRPTLVALLHAMERCYEGGGAIDADAVAARLDAALAETPGCELLIAETGGRPVGVASFATLFPSDGLTRQFFLKDLFVVEDARHRGVGRALMATLARLARQRNIGRIDWTTGAANAGARALYDGIGADARRDVVFYRMERAAIARLAEEG